MYFNCSVIITEVYIRLYVIKGDGLCDPNYILHDSILWMNFTAWKDGKHDSQASFNCKSTKYLFYKWIIPQK